MSHAFKIEGLLAGVWLVSWSHLSARLEEAITNNWFLADWLRSTDSQWLQNAFTYTILDKAPK